MHVLKYCCFFDNFDLEMPKNMTKTIHKPQNFHLGFFTNHFKLVNLIPVHVVLVIYNLQGSTLPAVELDNAIWFGTLSRMSGILCHSSKWDWWFCCFFQYTFGLEVLPCSLDTDLNYEIIMLQLYQGVSESKFWW